MDIGISLDEGIWLKQMSERSWGLLEKNMKDKQIWGGRKENSESEGGKSEMSVRCLSGDDQQAVGYATQERNLGQRQKWESHWYTDTEMRDHRDSKK